MHAQYKADMCVESDCSDSTIEIAWMSIESYDERIRGRNSGQVFEADLRYMQVAWEFRILFLLS
jgi:hypothetical protein